MSYLFFSWINNVPGLCYDERHLITLSNICVVFAAVLCIELAGSIVETAMFAIHFTNTSTSRAVG